MLLADIGLINLPKGKVTSLTTSELLMAFTQSTNVFDLTCETQFFYCSQVFDTTPSSSMMLIKLGKKESHCLFKEI